LDWSPSLLCLKIYLASVFMIILSFGRYLANSQCEQEVITHLTQSLACFQFTLSNPICKPQPMGKPKWMATLECSPPFVHITRVFPTIDSYLH
jgi:hypothetical protein